MILFLTLIVIILAIFSIYNTWMVYSLKKSLVKIIGPKLDEIESRYVDLIKKLKKIL